jgi:ATP-independent RNA helicase DbpA
LTQTDFSSLPLQAALLKNISSLGYTEMTPIQAQSLPPILAGRDVIAQGQTGSGKTAAYGLPLLEKLNIESLRVQSLVLCPTRELADQVSQAIRQLARTLPNVKVLTLSGGMPFRPQAASLEHGAHIVVGTPGRVAKHLRKETLRLNALTTLVLDEGDRMLEMGFQDELDAILVRVPSRRQTLLFSATYPPEIRSIAERIMTRPVMVEVAPTRDCGSIEQHFYKVSEPDQRLDALRLLLQHYRPESTVVFCNTKLDAQSVRDQLADCGFSALALHGDLEQYERDETLVRFANKSASILVATDVAARGLDIDSLDAVINYHVSREFDVHVHRIGRTGRAGKTGLACSLYSPKEHHKISMLEEYLGEPIQSEALPEQQPMNAPKMRPPMATLKVGSGKKQKIRAGNILGALTGPNGLNGDQVGKITVCDNWTYVAVERSLAKQAIAKLASESWKGRPIHGRLVQD